MSQMKANNQKETTTKEIAKNIFLHTSKMALVNTEDLAHTLYTYTVRNFKNDINYYTKTFMKNYGERV